MKNRREEIMSCAEQAIPELFLRSSKKTALFCGEHSRETVGGFLEAFKSVMDQVVKLQDQEEKEKVKYLLISHLYSSMLLKQYLIRIDVMDQGFYNDSAQAASYWDAEPVYRLFEEDIKEIKKKVEKSVPRIREYEVDYIRYAYAPYYHRMAKVFIQAMLEELRSENRFLPDRDRREEQVEVLFGEYMGQADILFTLGK